MKKSKSFVRNKEYWRTTYIIAHQEKWKSIYNERKATAAVSAESSEESNVVVKRGRRSV